MYSWRLSRALRFAVVGAVALACQGQTPRFVTVGDVQLPIVVKPQFYSDCRSAAEALASREAAVAYIGYTFGAVPDRNNPNKHFFVVAVDTKRSYIEMPLLTWPTITPDDTKHLTYLNDALEWHERGHLGIAVQIASEVTAAQHPVTSPADVRAQADEVIRISNARQTAYDALTMHGIHQSRAPEPFHGSDTIFYCR